MNTLVIDHSYALGIAWDRTRFRNHGVLHHAPPGSGYFNGTLSFAKGRTNPGSLVVVPPAPSLERIGSVRARAQIYLDPKTNPRRHNIVEGHLSFALVVSQDDSVRGTFLAPDNVWIGIKSPPGAVPHRKWTDVDFWYDGVGGAEIRVDGARVASSYDAASLMVRPLAGPVRGVGPLGVFVGHWAALDDRYTFDGHIRRAQVYKRDDDDLRKLFGRCCKPDPAFAHGLAERLRERGVGADGIREALDAIEDMGADLFRGLAGGDEESAGELRRLLEQYLYALRHRDGGVPLEPSLRGLLAWIADRADRDQLMQAAERYTALAKKLPLRDEEIAGIVDRLCLGGAADAVRSEVGRMVDDDEWRRRVEKFRRGGRGGDR